ncbi:hypothetical protein HPCPY6081_0287 [Helicobacter pylori CPY6081]|nr:hypothetical protein HPCPY6081_0287 [Helicobacter pylori CPY6081]
MVNLFLKIDRYANFVDFKGFLKLKRFFKQILFKFLKVNLN